MEISQAIEIIETRRGYLNTGFLETLEWMNDNWWIIDEEEQRAYRRFMRDARQLFAPKETV